jgi:hypothetical protein
VELVRSRNFRYGSNTAVRLLKEAPLAIGRLRPAAPGAGFKRGSHASIHAMRKVLLGVLQLAPTRKESRLEITKKKKKERMGYSKQIRCSGSQVASLSE